mgnify:CR=1 FL=1
MLVTAASAQPSDPPRTPVVVELFTSQGCSSCPPADAMLAELGTRDDVIALAFHVDYWDYIGWADRFADPRHTRRQKGYAVTGGWRVVYTPQVIIDGHMPVMGSRPDEVRNAIDAQADRTPSANLSVTRADGMLIVTGQSLREALGKVDIHVIRYEARRDVTIERGENAGRALTYTHIVRDWTVPARWSGEGSFEIRVPIEGDLPVVVLAQGRDYGPIFAAARLR